MPKKVYYLATGPDTFGPNSFEWVDSLEEATAVKDKEAAEATQKRFEDTELVEIPPKHPNEQSKWVISKDAD
jgi:protein involved in temperature-dependent protein secretion